MIELTYSSCNQLVRQNILPRIRIMTEEGTVRLYGVPRGGVPVALMVMAMKGELPGRDLVMVENVRDADVALDDIVDSGATKKRIQQENPRCIFLALTAKKDYNDWIVFPWEGKDEAQGPVENVRRLLEYIGDDPNREGLLETPDRVIRSYERLFGGYRQDPRDVMKTFVEGACDDMVVLKDIELYSTCEHHMLPFYGKCHIAYIPNGKVIGVSKLARLMEIYSRRLQIQERIGQQVTEALERYLQPKGAACIIEAQHFCMTSRGVEKQHAKMVTSSLTGVFRDSLSARQELMNFIKE